MKFCTLDSRTKINFPKDKKMMVQKPRAIGYIFFICSSNTQEEEEEEEENCRESQYLHSKQQHSTHSFLNHVKRIDGFFFNLG